MTGGLGLGDAYCATIERIKAQGGDKPRLGMEALMWISHAERPLSADRVPNGRGWTVLDWPVQSKVKSSPRVEIGLTKES